MGQKANLITLRKNQSYSVLGTSNKNSFLNGFDFLNNFKTLLLQKNILITNEVLSFEESKLFLNCKLFFKTKKIKIYQRKIKQINKNSIKYNIFNYNLIISKIFKKLILK